MTDERFSRTALLLGENAVDKLNNSRVILFGLGGVGSYTAEALARAGVGNITLVDSDSVSVTNINRQLCALNSTVGRLKTDVVKERILDINPNCSVTVKNEFYLPGENTICFSDYDYAADAIDTVSAKIDIAVRCYEENIPLISCMGTGNKLDASRFRISDIYKTDTCPLCRVMRNELRKRGVKKLNVVWSDEEPSTATVNDGSRHAPASVSFVPGAAGLIMAGKIISDLCKDVK